MMPGPMPGTAVMSLTEARMAPRNYWTKVAKRSAKMAAKARPVEKVSDGEFMT